MNLTVYSSVALTLLSNYLLLTGYEYGNFNYDNLIKGNLSILRKMFKFYPKSHNYYFII